MKYLYLRVIQDDPQVAKRNKTGAVVSRYFTKPTKNYPRFSNKLIKEFLPQQLFQIAIGFTSLLGEILICILTHSNEGFFVTQRIVQCDMQILTFFQVWLNPSQSEIFVGFLPKGSFKFPKNTRNLFRNVIRFQKLICFFR